MRIFSWNIAGNAVNSSSVTNGMTAAVVAATYALDAEFVCLQEVAYQQHQDLVARFGSWAKTAIFAESHPTKSAGGQPYGTSLFSKYVTTEPVTSTLGVADSYSEVRKMISVRYGNNKIACVHPTADTSLINGQLEVIRTIAEGWVSGGYSVYIAGDWNALYSSTSMAPWRSSATGWREAAYPDADIATHAGDKIDLVVYRAPDMDLNSEWVLARPYADNTTKLASDHNAIFANITSSITSSKPLETRLTALAQSIKKALNKTNSLIKGNNPDLSELKTSSKGNLLAAINSLVDKTTPTAWTEVALRSGFSHQGSTNKFQWRFGSDGNVEFRWGVSNANIAAASQNIIADLPQAAWPGVTKYLPVIGFNAASSAGLMAVIETTGTIQLRNAATGSSYYMFDAASYPPGQ